MQPRFFTSFMMAQATLISRGPRAYYGGMAAIQALTILAVGLWLVAPFAVWQAYGFLWMLLWLLPTCGAVFLAAIKPVGGG